MDPASVTSRLWLGVLGPTATWADGSVVVLRPRERDVLAALALKGRKGRKALPAEALADLMWPEGLPATAKVSVQNHVARIRKAIGREAIITEASTYRLGPDWTVDLEVFTQHIEQGRRRGFYGDDIGARVAYEKALALVRGDPFVDLPPGDGVVAERSRCIELARASEDDYLVALLASSDRSSVVAEATALLEADRFREVRWTVLALAQYRDGQRRDAVRTIQRGRELLREVSGLELGPALVRLEHLVLADDPSLTTSHPGSLVGVPRPALPGRPIPLPVFVGREDELRQSRHYLLGALEAQGPAQIVIHGPTGSGKSALAERIAAQAALDGWDVVSAVCHRNPSWPLDPLGALVRQVFDHVPDPEETFDSGLLADLRPLWAPSSHQRPRGDVGEAIVATFRAYAERSPILVVVDDAHHLASTARTLLGRLASMNSPIVPMLIRPRPTGGPGAAGKSDRDGDLLVLELVGLDLGDSTALLALLTRSEIEPQLAASLHLTTGGIPARLRQVADAGAEHGDLVAGPGVLVDALTTAVQAMPDLARSMARVLAVAGGPTSIEAIAAATDSTVAEVRSSVVGRSARAVFSLDRDELVDLTSEGLRDALGATLDAEEMHDEHERIGLALLAEGMVLAAAPHLLAVANRDPDRALEAAEAAARTASEATMFAESASLLQQASQVARAHREKADTRAPRLQLAQAEALRGAGDPGGVELLWSVLEEADEIADADLYARAAGALCSLGPLTVSGTLNRRLADVVERAVAECHDPATRSYVAGEATLFYSLSGRVERCRELFDVALAEARASGDDQALLGALGCVYVSLIHPDERDLRAELAGELLALAERLDDDSARFQALHLYFSVQVQQCDPLLRTTFARQEALAQSLRSAGRRWMVGYQRACIAHLDGRVEEALAIAQQTYAAAPVDPSRALSTYWMTLLVARLAQGRSAELADEIDLIIADQPGLPGWRALAAWLAAVRGDHPRAAAECDVLENGRALPADMSWSGAAMLLGRTAAVLGEAHRVTVLRELIEPYAGTMTWLGSATVGPFDLALTELALATGDETGARIHLSSAQRCVDRLSARVYQPEIDRLTARLS